MSCCQPSSDGRSPLVFFFPLVLLVLAGFSWIMVPQPATGRDTPDSLQVMATVTAFHEALEAGNRAGAMVLLAPGALIVENGAVETRSEYASHHLEADMAFAAAVERTAETVQVVITDSSAWVTSLTDTRGRYRNRDVESRGAETMVLNKGTEGWRICAIHWSSRDG